MAPATHTSDAGTAAPDRDDLARIAHRYYAHDAAARTHVANVARLALLIGGRLQLPRAELAAVAVGAILHDIGKLSVPAPVLEKPGRLTAAEWQLVREHPTVGAHLVGSFFRHPTVCAVVRWHHERIDGRGYPDGLRGETIPLAARIVALADAYEAMVAARSYSPARTPADALAEAVACAGKQFDVRCVERLSELVGSHRLVAA
jgi:putative nucleotidyltransferase with HDIG domain